LRYRDVEYNVVQGLGRQLWKWSCALEAKTVSGQAATKVEAVSEAERAIDRALTPKKLRIVRPSDDRKYSQNPGMIFLRRPLVFFTLSFVLVETFSNIRRHGRVVGVCDRCAVLLFDLFAICSDRKIIRL